MEDIDVKVNRDGSINVVITDTQRDGINQVHNAVESLKRATENYKNQIKQLEENIISNQEAIKHIKTNIEYSIMKRKVFEKGMVKLNKLGFVVKSPKNNVDKNKY